MTAIFFGLLLLAALLAWCVRTALRDQKRHDARQAKHDADFARVLAVEREAKRTSVREHHERAQAAERRESPRSRPSAAPIYERSTVSPLRRRDPEPAPDTLASDILLGVAVYNALSSDDSTPPSAPDPSSSYDPPSSDSSSSGTDSFSGDSGGDYGGGGASGEW